MFLNRKTSKINEILIDTVFFVFANILFAASVNIFTAPNDLAPGGLLGIATMLYSTFGFPIGFTTLLMNVPLFIWAYKKAGYTFFAKSVVPTLLGNLLLEITKPIIVNCALEYKGDPLIISISAGLISGAGFALIFMRGGTSGGVDIIASLLSASNSHISVGKFLLLIDAIILIISVFVYNIEKAFYAAVCVFVTTKVIDAIMYGVDVGNGKIMFIISKQNKEIAQSIIKDLARGVTELKSRGSYTGQEGEILLCAIRRYEIYKLYKLVHDIDQNAFMIVTEAREITGEGFKLLSSSIDNSNKKED
ncbi:MAG: YitT family protein [Oscillospiraceae bacterium]|jgi:uncharacterized membrane-anchored protein YitT (DUF2179 family)|nr:YitT family protein [Oscillospiraceae bacterium]